eukprot:1337129-Karenia_brevis.AAC.1
MKAGMQLSATAFKILGVCWLLPKHGATSFWVCHFVPSIPHTVDSTRYFCTIVTDAPVDLC